MQRVRSVDVLRGFALICMVLIHFVIYWGNEAATHTWLYFTFNDMLGDWGAAGFLMMMGISQVLSAAKSTDMPEILLFKKALIRSVYIFVVGLLMLALAWGPEQIWQWDILTLMGFATLVVYGCRFLPSWLILAISAAIAVATPWLRSLVDPVEHWGGAFSPTPFISDLIPGLFVEPAYEFTILWEPAHILQGFLVAGTFPVFPWLMFPLIGFVIGRRIVAHRFARDLPWLVGIGAASVALGLAGVILSMGQPDASPIGDYISPLSFYPDSFTMILAQLGIALIVFSALFYAYDVRPHDPAHTSFLTSIYNRTSRFSLTFYFLHYQLIGWPLLIIYLTTGEYLIFDLMDAWPALLSGMIAVVLLEWLILLWERRGGKFSLEWVLVVLTAHFVGTTPKLPDERHTIHHA